MADKIFGVDFTNETNPTGAETVSVHNGTALRDVRLDNVIAGSTNNSTAKATPVDADKFPFWDSVSTALRHATWANIKTVLNALYDWATVTHAATSKATPVDADELAIVDSAASNVIKRLTWANLKATLNSVYDWSTVTQAAAGKTTPVDADEFSITDSAASNVIKSLTWSNLKATLKTYFDTLYTGGGSADGWTSDANTWSYSSADSPTFVISVNADMTGTIGVGDRIKLTQTTAKYFIVTAVGTYSAGATLITVYGGTDYTLANAAISSPYYSHAKAPLGFPLSPTKWTVTFTDTTSVSQTTPTATTWYNLGSLSFSIPIGSWNVRYFFAGVIEGNASATSIGYRANISTGSGTESDASYTSAFISTGFAAGSSPARRDALSKQLLIERTTKATYYINAQTDTNNASAIRIRGDFATTKVEAICAYL